MIGRIGITKNGSQVVQRADNRVTTIVNSGSVSVFLSHASITQLANCLELFPGYGVTVGSATELWAATAVDLGELTVADSIGSIFAAKG